MFTGAECLQILSDAQRQSGVIERDFLVADLFAIGNELDVVTSPRPTAERAQQATLGALERAIDWAVLHSLVPAIGGLLICVWRGVGCNWCSALRNCRPVSGLR